MINQPTTERLDEAAQLARGVFEQIADGYMNGGDALSDAIYDVIGELFPDASEEEDAQIADALYSRLGDIEVD